MHNQACKRMLLLFSLSFLCCAANDLTSWENLSELRPGDAIRVYCGKDSGAQVRFQSVTPDWLLVIHGTEAPDKLARAGVRRVDARKTHSARAKHVAYGAAIGFGGGFAVGAAAGGCKTGFGAVGPCLSKPAMGGAAGGVGAVLGAAVGVVLPAHGQQVIYRAR